MNQPIILKSNCLIYHDYSHELLVVSYSEAEFMNHLYKQSEDEFDDLLNKMSDAFNVDIAYSIEYGSRHTTTQSIEV